MSTGSTFLAEQVRALAAHIDELNDEIVLLREQLADANARVGSLNGLVIETYHPQSSRHRDDARPPPWASTGAKEP